MLQNNNRIISGDKCDLFSPWRSSLHSLLERSVIYLELKYITETVRTEELRIAGAFKDGSRSS